MQSILVITKRLLVMNTYAWFGTKDKIALYSTLFAVIVVITRPFPDPFQSIFVNASCALILFRMIYLQFRPVEDEIEVAVLRFSLSAGLTIGITLTIGLLLLMAEVPAVSDFFFQIMANLNDKVITDPKAIFVRGVALGFGINVLLIIFSAMVIGVVKARWIQAIQDE